MISKEALKFYPLELDSIPTGWELTPLSFLCSHIKSGFACGVHNREGRGVPHIRPMNINRKGELNLSILKYVPEDKDEKRLQTGDVLFNNTNSPELVGKTCWIKTTENLAYSNHMTRINTSKGINSAYIAYYLHVLHMFGYFKYRCIKHVNQASVSTEPLGRTPIALAPENEQHRIVTKIEELLTKLDAGVEALKQVQVQLKRYRQSVLKAAIEGRLTAEWREQYKDELESAKKLLESIQIEQKAELGKRHKELMPIDTADMPELPEGWDWTSFTHIGELNRGKSKHRPRNDPKLYNGDYPFVQTGDIRNANKFVWSYSQTYNEIGLKQSRLWPKGTLCITIAANIADTAILDFDACFPDSIVGFSPNQSCNIFFIEYFLRTAKENLNRYAPATAQKNINLKILSELLIPLPQKIEQDKIVDELDRIFSVADQLDSIIEIELKRAQFLRQSILKRAFEGKLVPQDSNDEPASVLLERIKAEKAIPKKSKQLEMF